MIGIDLEYIRKNPVQRQILFFLKKTLSDPKQLQTCEWIGEVLTSHHSSYIDSKVSVLYVPPSRWIHRRKQKIQNPM